MPDTYKKLIQLKTKKEQDAYRQKLIKEQGNKCAITGLPLKKPALDHCHKTGQCRGVIENSLNRLLPERDAIRYGVKLEDLPNVLRQMANYLEKPLLDTLHLSNAPGPEILMKSSYDVLRRRYVVAKARGEILPKLPEYRYAAPTRKRTKEKPYQKMTKVLIGLFERFDIEPKFYAR